MAYLEKSTGEKEAKNISLKEIVDTANKSDYARAIETAKLVRGMLKEEKGRDSGLGMRGNLQYIPKGGNAIAIGDLHGDESSLVKILKETKFVERVNKGEKLTLVFLGDYIDVGPEPIEVLNIILELKRNFRENVVMLRGDHELSPTSPNYPLSGYFLKQLIPGYAGSGENINKVFFRMCNQKYGKFDSKMYKEYYEIFSVLPLAAKSDNGILFLHGGVSERINEANVVYGGDEMERDIMWNEPRQGIRGTMRNSDRGIGLFFGEDTFDEALRGMGCKVLIRGHELVKSDRVYMFNGKLLTINSNAIIGHSADKKFAVGYAEVSLENEVSNVNGLFHEI